MTISDLTTKLALYQAAETAILDGAQSYTINGRSLTRADLKTITEQIEALEARIARYHVQAVLSLRHCFQLKGDKNAQYNY